MCQLPECCVGKIVAMEWIVISMALLVVSVYGQEDGIPPNVFSDLQRNYIYRDSDKIELECKATGEPQPRYEWTKNGGPLQFGKFRNIQWKANQTEGSIIINPLTVLDEGYYQCSASNQYGKSLSQVAHLQKAFLGRYPPADPDGYTVTEGNSFKLECKGPKSFPAPTYSWTLVVDKSDQAPLTLRTSERIQIDESGNLYFSHVTPEDQQENKLYKCNLFNAHLDIVTGGSYSSIDVTPNPDVVDVLPTLLHSTGDITALKGERFEIKCIFGGRPEPQVTWEKIDGGENSRWRLSHYGTTLEVTDVRYEDAGVYKCHGSNSVGTFSATVEVQVYSKPEFQEKIMNTDTAEGSTHIFKCKTDARPTPETTWYINGEPLETDNTGKRRSISSDGSSLTVSNACSKCPDGSSDVMVVQCNVSNAYGYAFADGYLNVGSTGGTSLTSVQTTTWWYLQLQIAVGLLVLVKRVMFC